MDASQFYDEAETQEELQQQISEYNRQRVEQQQQADANNVNRHKHKRSRYDPVMQDEDDDPLQDDDLNERDSEHYPMSSLSSLTDGSSSSSSSSNNSKKRKRQGATDSPTQTAAVAAETEDKEWIPVPPSDEVFPEEADCVNPDFCFGCDNSQNRTEMINNPRYLALKKTADDNYGLLDPYHFATLMQDEYNQKLKDYTIDKKDWSKKMIHEHYTSHAPSNMIMLEDSLRVINAAMTVLKKQAIFLQHRVHTHKQSLHASSAKLYLLFFAQRRALIQEILGKRSGSVA